MTSIEIPNRVTTIGDWAFLNCSGVTSITIPDSVTSIGGSVFSNCSGLKSVIIGANISTIGYDAFRLCSDLTSVYYKGTANDWLNISIGSNNQKFISLARYYYSETQPTESGNYWHYVDGVVTKW